MGGGQVSNASNRNDALCLLQGRTVIYNTNNAVDVQDETLRTVTAGKTFYLMVAGITFKTGANPGMAYISSNSKADNILIIDLPATSHFTTALMFPQPIPFAPGETIQISTSSVGCSAYAWITGWEE